MTEGQQADAPLGFFDVEVGNRWTSQAKVVTREMVLAFAELTGDFNPLHVDEEFAKNTPFRQPIAHGLLGISLVAGLGSHSPLMKTAAFLRIREWNFKAAVFFGDSVHVETEILEKIEQARGRRGIVVWRRQLVNQNGEIVQEGMTETLVEGRTKPASS